MNQYRIKINRKSNRLIYEGNSIEVNARCWWDKNNEIPAGRYSGCSKTRMAGKGLKGIYLPDSQTGKTGIFIHMGASEKSSDGCIVINEAAIQKIWDDIEPENGRNITVIVSDGSFVV